MAVGATMAAVGVATGATPIAMQGLQKMGQGMGTVTGSRQPSRLTNAGLSAMNGLGGIDETTAVSPPSQPVKADGSERSDNGRLRANMESATQSPKAEQSDAPKQNMRLDPLRRRIEWLGRAKGMLSPEIVEHGEEAIKNALGALWQTIGTYRTEGVSEAEIATEFLQGNGIGRALAKLPTSSPFQDKAQMNQLVKQVFAKRFNPELERHRSGVLFTDLVPQLVQVVQNKQEQPLTYLQNVLGTEPLAGYEGMVQLLVSRLQEGAISEELLFRVAEMKDEQEAVSRLTQTGLARPQAEQVLNDVKVLSEVLG